MKKFILIGLVFLISFLVITHILYKLHFFDHQLIARAVYRSINRSLQEDSQTRYLVAGDSVALQLFESLNARDTVTTLANTASIGLVGNYLLIDDFLQRNHSVEEVYVIFNPFSLAIDLNDKHVYNYFLKPFNNIYYRKRFTPHVMNQVNKVPYGNLSRLSLIKISNFSPYYSPDKTIPGALSQSSREYLHKMEELTLEKGIRFMLLSPPLRESKQKAVLNKYRKYNSTSYRSELVDFFFQNIIYLPDSYFRDDLHLHDEYINEAKDLYIKKFGMLKDIFQKNESKKL